MPPKKLIVAGANGIVGRACVDHFARQHGCPVVGLSRRSSDLSRLAGVEIVSVDLRDREATRSALSRHRDATHAVYAALYEKPDLIAGWRERDHREINASMFQNFLDAVDSPQLHHVTLVQGAKAYGTDASLPSPIPLPCKERAPRVEHENFYFLQEDELAGRRDVSWQWTILRPQVLFGFGLGSPMNVVASIAGFAALLKAADQPLTFPGHPNQITEVADASLLARAIDWAGADPRCTGEIFNITNGDVLCFHDVWPRVARFFEMELGGPKPMKLSEVMPTHAAAWQSLVARQGLRAGYDELLAPCWAFADLIWADPALWERPPLLSTIKARKHGFAECVDSEDSLFEQLERLRSERYIP